MTRYILVAIKSGALRYFLLEKIILLRNVLPPTLSIESVLEFRELNDFLISPNTWLAWLAAAVV